MGNRSRLLGSGVAVGVGGLVVAVALGAAANARPAGLGVASELASNSLHLRSIVALSYACVALLISALWPSLCRDTAILRRLRRHVTALVVLCGVGPVLLLALNYAIVAGLTPAPVALLSVPVVLAVAGLYAIVLQRLAGLSGVGLGARLMLQSSYVWLIVAAALQATWIVARVLGDRPDLLWFLERPALEMATIGFALTGSLAVLLTNLNCVYHSRNMTQALMRSYQFVNALVALWGLALMWALRFPGGYQGLVAAVIGVGLMIAIVIIAKSSGLLDRGGPVRLGRKSGDGVWAGLLASAAMVLTVIVGVLIGLSGGVLAGLGDRPLEGLLAAQIMVVGFGVVPLCVAAAVAPSGQSRATSLMIGGLLIALGVLVVLVLQVAGDLVDRSFGAQIVGGEVVIGLGLLLVGLAIWGHLSSG